MTSSIFEEFTESGYVPHWVLILIALRIKKGIDLSAKELAIYQEKASDIENIIKSI